MNNNASEEEMQFEVESSFASRKNSLHFILLDVEISEKRVFRENTIHFGECRIY